MRDFWKEFFNRFLSPQTARFILALLALGAASYAAKRLLDLIGQGGNQEPGQAVVFAIGQLFALATMAFGYYFGSTARRDDNEVQPVRVTNPPKDPVPVEPTGDQ